MREQLSGRLGFLLVAAGCAIGLGNIWRFPFIAGEYGGGAFVLIYLLAMVFLGLPILVMEFSIGRAGRLNIVGALRELEPEGSKWHIWGYLAIGGNYLLMMFYTVICGWVLFYFWSAMTGGLIGLSPQQVGGVFGSLLQNPWKMSFWMGLTVFSGFFICAIGLVKGVERVTKIMMAGLFILLLILAARALTLPGAAEGISFFLKPDFGRMMEKGLWVSIYAAMGQAFFSLSLGIGCMAIFGSYIDREQRLAGESVNVAILDTAASLLAGIIIFSACFAFGVDVAAGPGLAFIALPNVFNHMVGGYFWATLFFLLLSLGALTTVVAVFENIIAFSKENLGWSRRKACVLNALIIFFGSLPCILGFNILSGIEPMGPGSNILSLQDFIVSKNLLPLGGLIFVLFCCHRYGWGWDKFIDEANQGEGMKFPRILRFYFAYILPIVMLVILVQGYREIFKF